MQLFSLIHHACRFVSKNKVDVAKYESLKLLAEICKCIAKLSTLSSGLDNFQYYSNGDEFGEIGNVMKHFL